MYPFEMVLVPHQSSTESNPWLYNKNDAVDLIQPWSVADENTVSAEFFSVLARL